MKYWIIEWLSMQWQLGKTSFNFLRAIYYLFKIQQPIVSIFGGKRVPQNTDYAQKAKELGYLLAKHNFGVITGGGPGIMEAANSGANMYENEKKDGVRRTLGIGLHGVDVDYCNPFAKVISVNEHFIRQYLLIHYSSGYVIFPGGIGTASELFKLLDLIKLEKFPKFPIILYGSDYWKNLVSWYENIGLATDYIPQRCSDLFLVTDDIDEIVCIITKNCK